MSSLGNWIADRLTRLLQRHFGGVTPDLLLDKETMLQIRSRGRRGGRGFYWWLALSHLTLGGLLSVLVIMLLRWLDGPSINPILDLHSHRLLIGVPIAMLLLMFWLAVQVEVRATKADLGLRSRTWVRYFATANGWTPRRHFAILTLVLFPMAGFAGWGMWQWGEVVDERGITAGRGWGRATRPYAQVRAVTVYDALNAPIGLVQRPNLVVVFADGTTWRYTPENNAPVRPDQVGAYIGTRAALPVARVPPSGREPPSGGDV